MTTLNELVPSYLDVTRLVVASFRPDTGNRP